jgi:hypothetical protein
MVFAKFWYFKHSFGFLENFFRRSFRVSVGFHLGFHLGFHFGFHLGFHSDFISGFILGFFRVSCRVSYQDFQRFMCVSLGLLQVFTYIHLVPCTPGCTQISSPLSYFWLPRVEGQKLENL